MIKKWMSVGEILINTLLAACLPSLAFYEKGHSIRNSEDQEAKLQEEILHPLFNTDSS